MITFEQKGDFKKLFSFLEKMKEPFNLGILNKYGERGIMALSAATPVDSAKTSRSWYYKIEHGKGYAKLIFCNSNIQNGVPIAVILQYGHATKNGGWVEGRDYINPAIQPIFDEIANKAWEEVKRK